MRMEIEMKAWVRRPEETLARIEKFCRFEREYLKEDLYFRSPAAGMDIRIRREDGLWICTHKNKTIRNGLEVNEETEFTLSDGPALSALLEAVGCRIFLRKTKKGKSYSRDGLTVEVSEVLGLGLFVEVECLLTAPSPEEIERTEGRIRLFLRQAGVRDEEIEESPYALMLAEAGRSGLE